MADDQLDPYYERKSRKNSETILFWACIGIAAVVCLGVVWYINNRLETLWMPILKQ